MERELLQKELQLADVMKRQNELETKLVHYI